MNFKIEFLLLIPFFISNIWALDFQNTQSPMRLIGFSKKLLRQILYQDSEKNIVLSPLPIQLYLSLFYFPATEDTRQELRFALNIAKNASDESILEFVNKKIKDLAVTTIRGMDILLNTVIIGQELHQNFHKIALNNYESHFVRDDRITAEKVNRFVAGGTRKKMKKSITDGDLRNKPFAILMHTLFLDAKWATPFDNSLTSYGIFYQNGVDPVEVDMMYLEKTMLYGEYPTLNAKMIILPYVMDKLRLYIVLPNDRNGLNELEEDLLNDEHGKLKPIMRKTNVALTLPKFNFQYHIKLKDILQRIGMRSSFTKYANFTKMFDERLDPVFVEVNQRTNFDVSEGGSGSTGGLFMNLGSPRQKRSILSKPITFTVNHPFFFYVRTKNYMYYIGHIVNIPLFK